MDNKFCSNCGKELPKEASFCPYCMTELIDKQIGEAIKTKSNKKSIIIFATLICVIIVLIATVLVVAFSNSGSNSDKNNNTAASTKIVENSSNATDSTTTGENSNESGTDNEVGFKNIKADSKTDSSEEQKIISQYFDNDYIDILDYGYVFLARYPTIFEGSQICFTGTVEKLISSTDEDYKVLVWLGRSYNHYYYRRNTARTYEKYKEDTKNDLIIVTGKQTDTRLLVGDEIVVYGRYNKIETQKIDETSYTIPTVTSYRTFFNKAMGAPEKFDSDFIRKVSKVLFGNDVEIRNAKDGEDYDLTQDMFNCNYSEYPFMICELENQSNAKFTKYRMHQATGVVEDAKSKSDFCKTGTSIDDEKIIRKIEFAPDLKHYIIYTFDTELETLSVGYYDSNLQKIWQRGFEQTLNGVYDYTSKNFYLVANNDLYVIDMQTGKDVIKPSFVGQKSDIRKVADGIIMFSLEKSDSVMKVDNNGDIVWKTNLNNDDYIKGRNSVQFVNNRLIISNFFVSFELDAKTGELVTVGQRDLH